MLYTGLIKPFSVHMINSHAIPTEPNPPASGLIYQMPHTQSMLVEDKQRIRASPITTR
jgi:hypothetical protein